MDQMTSVCGEANKLLAMVCQVCIAKSAESCLCTFTPLVFHCSFLLCFLMQPAEVKESVSIPTHMRFWGFDSGIRHRFALFFNLIKAAELIGPNKVDY